MEATLSTTSRTTEAPVQDQSVGGDDREGGLKTSHGGHGSWWPQRSLDLRARLAAGQTDEAAGAGRVSCWVSGCCRSRQANSALVRTRESAGRAAILSPHSGSGGHGKRGVNSCHLLKRKDGSR
jgi:hypothetical protein